MSPRPSKRQSVPRAFFCAYLIPPNICYAWHVIVGGSQIPKPPHPPSRFFIFHILFVASVQLGLHCSASTGSMDSPDRGNGANMRMLCGIESLHCVEYSSAVYFVSIFCVTREGFPYHFPDFWPASRFIFHF